jgi:hypothetical protein
VALICILRYGQLLEQSRHSWVNTTALITGCTNAAGLLVVGNFQVLPHLSLHCPLVGTGCLQGQYLMVRGGGKRDWEAKKGEGR